MPKFEVYTPSVEPTPSVHKGHVTKPPVDKIGGCEPQHPKVPEIANRIHLYAGEQIVAEWQSDVTVRFRLSFAQKILTVLTVGLFYIYLYLTHFIFKCCRPQSGTRVFQRLVLTSQGRLISVFQEHVHNKSVRTPFSPGSEYGMGKFSMKTYAIDRLTMIQRMVDRPAWYMRALGVLCCKQGNREMTTRFVFDSFPDALDDHLIRGGVGGADNPVKVEQLGANRVEDMIRKASRTGAPIGAPVGSMGSDDINFEDPASAMIGIAGLVAHKMKDMGCNAAIAAFNMYNRFWGGITTAIAGDAIAFTDATQMISMKVSVSHENTDWANKTSSDAIESMENFVAAVTGMRGSTSAPEFASVQDKAVDVDMDFVKAIQGEVILDKVGVPAAGTPLDIILVIMTGTLWYWLILKPIMDRSGCLVLTDRRVVYYYGMKQFDYCSVSYYVRDIKMVRKTGKYGARMLTDYGFMTIDVPESFGPDCMPCGGALVSPEPLIHKMMQPAKGRRLIDYNQLCQSFPSMRNNNPAGDLPSDFFPKGFLLPDESMVAVAETDDFYNMCPNTGTWLSVKIRHGCCCVPLDRPVLILTSHRLILHSHLKTKWNECFPMGKILRVLGWCIPYFQYKYRNWLVCDLSRVRGVSFEGTSSIQNKTCPVVLFPCQPVCYTCICCPKVNSNIQLNIALEGFSSKALSVNKQHMDNPGIVQDSQMASMINVLSFVTNLNKFVKV